MATAVSLGVASIMTVQILMEHVAQQLDRVHFSIHVQNLPGGAYRNPSIRDLSCVATRTQSTFGDERLKVRFVNSLREYVIGIFLCQVQVAVAHLYLWTKGHVNRTQNSVQADFY